MKVCWLPPFKMPRMKRASLGLVIHDQKVWGWTPSSSWQLDADLVGDVCTGRWEVGSICS